MRVYARVGERFVAALGDGGLRRATVEGVQAALEAMRVRADGQPVKDATVNTYVGAVKSFLGFAHRVGYTRFNAAPFIKLKKAPRQVAQRIMGELETRKLIDAANPGLWRSSSRFSTAQSLRTYLLKNRRDTSCS